MEQEIENEQIRWRRMVAGLQEEFASLSTQELQWISPRLAQIASLQEQIHALFLRADGVRLCGECHGLCCDCGKNHLTLVNLLGCLLRGRSVPEPDFARPCPFLGERGCLLEPGQRPFNCVTFVCEGVEERMGSEGRAAFYGLERSLRKLYLEFDGRFAGSSLRGIFIRAGRLGGRPFLSRP